MTVPYSSLYPILCDFFHSLFGPFHLASFRSVSDLLWALLLCQSLHSSDLARALPALQTSRARQALRRVRRIIQRSHLTSSYLSPLLIHTVLRLLPDEEIFLVLDSTRCKHWEIFTLGIQFRGRVFPVCWSILPYPWPKGSFTPTVVKLLKAAFACWPNDRSVHLLADRGFPSLKVFRELDSWRKIIPLGYTIRLRAGDWLRLENGQSVKIGDLLSNPSPGTWLTYRASYQRSGEASPLAFVYVGRGVPIYPSHQLGPADQARREKRASRRQTHLLSKGQSQAPNTDTIWVLFSTASSCPAAIGRYGRRFSTEGTYRDLKSWDLEAVASQEKNLPHLDGLIGLAFIGYIVQAAIGMEAGRAEENQARARQQQWSTTDRLSIFWRGRQVLHDHGHDWSAWLSVTLQGLTYQLMFKTTIANNTCSPHNHLEEVA